MVAAAGTDFKTRKTISVFDLISKRSFLVDSGADECVFPATRADALLLRGPSLVAANGSSIPTYGKRIITLSFADGPSELQIASFLYNAF